jgi:hypothetical protein
MTRLIGLFRFAFLVCPLHLALSCEPGFEVSLQVTGGAHRVFRHGIDHPVLQVSGWSRDSTSHHVTISFEAFDFFNRPKPEVLAPLELQLPADSSTVSVPIPLTDPMGYRAIFATVADPTGTITRFVDLGIVWPPYPGARPNSFFATNAGVQQEEDLQLLETIGMKVERLHFAPDVATTSQAWPKELPAGQAVPLDFKRLDKMWNDLRAHGLWVLPIAGNPLFGAGTFDRPPLAEQLGMYGPPNDYERFIQTWDTILRHYPDFTTIEFWNEPWTFGWTWAATPGDYRELQKAWCEMALKINPRYRLLAGNSNAFVRDEIEPFPDCWEGLLDGITNHPYAEGVIEPNFRSGDVFRSIDETRLTARDLGLPYAYLTEGGTSYQTPSAHQDPSAQEDPHDNIENAQKLVQYYVYTALAGLFMGNAQWEIGYGPGWTRSNTAFAVLTHFLEDRVPLIDIWPQQELLWGGIFANHKFATAAIESLPRGAELTSRWNVAVPPERDRDDTKVAVIWGLTGQSAQWLDTHGELVISDPTDLLAYDMMGEEIAPSNGKLILPLSANPVYVTSESLDVLTLRDRIRNAYIRRLTPINFDALSLQGPASEKQDLIVRLQNQINRRLNGTLALRVAGTKEVNSTRFGIDPGELAEIPVSWPNVPVRTDNRYRIRLTASLDLERCLPCEAGSVGNLGRCLACEADSVGNLERCLACEADSVGNAERAASGPSDKPEQEANPAENFPPFSQEQTIAVARFEKKTLHLTGAISDWADLTPLTIDSKLDQKAGTDATYLSNPNQKPKPDHISEITAQVYTAYDDDFVYLGAAVHEDHFSNSAGHSFTAVLPDQTIALPYGQGEPDGLRFITECGNTFQFSFGFRDRVPFTGRQTTDVWAWKGDFYDTDYSYVAHVSTEGDQLIRIWSPDKARRNGYQTETVPGIGPVPGGRVKITRDDASKITLYEVAIPRRQLALFNPDTGTCRFGFILYNSELPNGGTLAWSDAAGVFDYWQTPGSFPPTWRSHLACQTFFGIER